MTSLLLKDSRRSTLISVILQNLLALRCNPATLRQKQPVEQVVSATFLCQNILKLCKLRFIGYYKKNSCLIAHILVRCPKHMGMGWVQLL